MRYDEMLSIIPSPRVLLANLATWEAVLSSRIEGTQATMGDVLEFQALNEETSSEPHSDVREVTNYIHAIRKAEEMLNELPLCKRVICEAHKVLLSGVRGHGRALGEYRRIQNWIGRPGCTLQEARFVPHSAGTLTDAMSNWESYMHQDAPDRLVQLAILHAEFEALHPFLDGNGRLGRMLVPLFLWQRNVIKHPVFYISAYFEAHRDDYYEKLLAISRDDDWTGWCRFFLEAVQVQAEDHLNKANAILKLYDDLKNRVTDLTRSPYAIRALDWIFKNPIFSSTAFVKKADIPEPTARRFLAVLRENGILEVMKPGHGRKPTLFGLPDLLLFHITEK